MKVNVPGIKEARSERETSADGAQGIGQSERGKREAMSPARKGVRERSKKGIFKKVAFEQETWY